ncbi:MAG: ROK family protein [Christensenellales bacterium]
MLLGLIRESGIATRNQLVALTHLKNATITIIINEFLQKGLIEETGLVDGGNGRRVMGFRIANRFCCVSIRLSVSYLKFSVYDIHMNNLYVTKTFIDTLADLSFTCDVIAREMRAAQECIGDKSVVGIGVGVEGPFVIKDERYQYFDSRTGQYFDLGKELHNRTGHLVIINRMSNYTAYRAWNQLLKDDLGIVISFNISYTLECGIIFNGEMLSGAQGLTGMIGNVIAGKDEDGHVLRYNDLISVPAIIDRTIRLLDAYPESSLHQSAADLNIRDVIAAYAQEDPLAVHVYRECAQTCGKAISVLIELMNPDVVFFGDEIPNSEAYMALVYQEAIKNLKHESAVRFAWMGPSNTMTFISPEKTTWDKAIVGRLTKLDPSLTGAADYVFSVVLGGYDSIEYMENQE